MDNTPPIHMDIDEDPSAGSEGRKEKQSTPHSSSNPLSLAGRNDILMSSGFAQLNLEESSATQYQQDYDFFKPELTNWWIAILRKIPDAGTVLALKLTPKLRVVAEQRKNELALLSILRKVELPKNTLLTLRLGSKRFRDLVDEFMIGGQNSWLQKKYNFDNLAIIKKFRSDPAVKIKETSLISHLLSLCVDSQELFVSQMLFLQQHGSFLKRISLIIAVGHPDLVYNRLCSLLTYLPNAKTLIIKFVNAKSGGTVIPHWADPSYNNRILPSLENLRELVFTFEDHHHHVARVNNLLGRYGLNLTKLTIAAEVFKGICLELCNGQLSNLQELRLKDVFNGVKVAAFDKLASVNWPRMKTLILEGNLDSMSFDFIRAIGSFSRSLMVLDVAGLQFDWRRFSTSGFHLGDWVSFPKMEMLFIRPGKDFHSAPMWQVFQIKFRMLKSITFSGGWAWKVENEFISETPFSEWLIRYFCMFPELHIITKMGVGGPNNSYKERVYKRSNFLR